MTTVRPTLTELTECYKLFERADLGCSNCIWQDACQERRNTMVNVSGDLMDNPAIAEVLQPPKRDIVDPLSGEVLNAEPITERKKKQILRLLNTTKSIYPLCYCKICKGDTKHPDCPNQDNPHPRAKSIWFKALRGEPIIAVERR